MAGTSAQEPVQSHKNFGVWYCNTEFDHAAGFSDIGFICCGHCKCRFGMLRGMRTCVLHGPGKFGAVYGIAFDIFSHWLLSHVHGMCLGRFRSCFSNDTTVVEKAGLEETLISMSQLVPT